MQNEVKIIECPWKLAVIDNALPLEIADYLRDNFPKSNREKIKDFYQHPGPAKLDDPLFEQFFFENWTRRDEMHKTAHEILGLDNSDDSVLSRWNYTYFPPGDSSQTIRDWHLDLNDKKIQYIYYVGYDDDDVTLECGNENDPQYKMPFVHNRFIFWHANDISWHRFFYCKNDRFTVNLTSQYNWSETNYSGLEEYI